MTDVRTPDVRMPPVFAANRAAISLTKHHRLPWIARQACRRCRSEKVRYTVWQSGHVGGRIIATAGGFAGPDRTTGDAPGPESEDLDSGAGAAVLNCDCL